MEVLMKSIVPIAAVLIMALAITSTADVPKVINYQGRLTDSLGDPVDGIIPIGFAIYGSETGADTLWSSGTRLIQVTGGLLSYQLGDTTALPDGLFATGAVRYLGIRVSANSEIAPRTRLTSMAYTFSALRADTADFALSGDDGDWAGSGDDIYRLDGNVGIGTDSPNGKLHVSGTLRIESPDIVQPRYALEAVGHNHNAVIGAFSNSTVSSVAGFRVGRSDGDELTQLWALTMDGQATGVQDFSLTDYMLPTRCVWTAQQGTGNLGIGTFSPTEKLDVVGNLVVSGKATIGPGQTNTGEFAFVAGDSNTVTEGWSSILGGRRNAVFGGQSTICGGWNNAIEVNAGYSVVGGGYQNELTGNAHNSVIAGGQENSCTEMYGAIGGGIYNIASAWYTVVGGGWGNEVSAASATVAGGFDNSARGGAAAVGGGAYCQASGDYSAIPGGRFDTVTANAHYSMAFGREVYVDVSNQVVFFDGTNHGRLGISRDDHDGGINHPIHVGTNTNNGNGAYLTAGGTWTNGSSREFKENFQSLDRDELLASIAAMQIDSWNFKNTDERHIGPIAEDFVAAFDVGTVRESDGQRENQYLSASDVAGVSLAAVQVLLEKIEQLETRIAELEAQNR